MSIKLEDLNHRLQDQVRQQLGLVREQETDDMIPATQSKDERELQRLCEQELCRRDIPFLHLSFRAREKSGWPDLTFPLHGRFIAVELKSETGRLSKDQSYVLEKLKRKGAVVQVIRSYQEFKMFVDKIGSPRECA